jgi:hypothetical protein
MGYPSPAKCGVVTEGTVLSAVLLYVGPWVDLNRADMVSGLPANGYPIEILAGSYDLATGSRTQPKPPVAWQNRQSLGKTASRSAKPLVTGMEGPR